MTTPKKDTLTEKLLDMKRQLERQNAELTQFERDLHATGDVAPPDAFFRDLDEACELIPTNFAPLAIPIGLRA